MTEKGDFQMFPWLARDQHVMQLTYIMSRITWQMPRIKYMKFRQNRSQSRGSVYKANRTRSSRVGSVVSSEPTVDLLHLVWRSAYK